MNYMFRYVKNVHLRQVPYSSILLPKRLKCSTLKRISDIINAEMYYTAKETVSADFIVFTKV